MLLAAGAKEQAHSLVAGAKKKGIPTHTLEPILREMPNPREPGFWEFWE
jgi:hypothetical protein